jgi:hypothetical protein
MDTLPHDIIERILQMREIYIVIRSHPSAWSILGFFCTLCEAQDKIISYALSNDIDERLYDPTQRFRLYRLEKTWIDKWQTTIGVDDYSIEVWKPNNENPSQTIYFNLDVYIKKYIIENQLKTDDIFQLFKQWKESPPLEELYQCFSPELRRACPIVECNDWYGFKA